MVKIKIQWVLCAEHKNLETSNEQVFFRVNCKFCHAFKFPCYDHFYKIVNFCITHAFSHYLRLVPRTQFTELRTKSSYFLNVYLFQIFQRFLHFSFRLSSILNVYSSSTHANRFWLLKIVALKHKNNEMRNVFGSFFFGGSFLFFSSLHSMLICTVFKNKNFFRKNWKFLFFCMFEKKKWLEGIKNGMNRFKSMCQIWNSSCCPAMKLR